MALRTA